jgi:hypothetical protein
MPKYSAIPTSAVFVYYKGLVIKEIEKKIRETGTRKRRRTNLNQLAFQALETARMIT